MVFFSGCVKSTSAQFQSCARVSRAFEEFDLMFRLLLPFGAEVTPALLTALAFPDEDAGESCMVTNLVLVMASYIYFTIDENLSWLELKSLFDFQT